MCELVVVAMHHSTCQHRTLIMLSCSAILTNVISLQGNATFGSQILRTTPYKVNVLSLRMVAHNVFQQLVPCIGSCGCGQQ